MFRQSQYLQQFLHIQRILRQILADLDIFLHRQIRHQIIKLENKTQLLPTVIGKCFTVKPRHLLSIHYDGTGIHGIQSSDAVEQRGFAGTTGTLNDTHFTFFHSCGDSL